MSWIADAHREWHTVNGARAVCPLDCGASEPSPDEEYEAYFGRSFPVHCGHCKSYHDTIEEVKACSQVKAPA